MQPYKENEESVMQLALIELYKEKHVMTITVFRNNACTMYNG